MRIAIIGGGGMVGQKLAARLAGDEPAWDVTLHDIAFPEGSAPGHQIPGNFATPQTALAIAAQRYDVIFQLASVVSGEAEADFDKGWHTNLWPMWHLLEGLRAQHEASGGSYRPKLIFTSSIAVFGGPLPDTLPDDFALSPQTSYGAQKAMVETLIQDVSRKGYIDGISLRLPTICVRPGKPNKAASSFFSGIIREPLSGQPARLPVADTVRHTHASPRAAAGFLHHAATLPADALGPRRALSLPGVAVTVAQQIEALRQAAGQKAVDLIQPDPDPAIAAIVNGWPQAFEATRARDLGFRAESSFDEIIQTYIDDDLPR
ncbi:MAG: D-erythronate dehydrogenase [Pseudomonadota bacterium]